MRTPVRRWVCTAAASLLIAGSAAAVAPTASAARYAYEKTPYSATVWKVVPVADGSMTGSVQRTAMTFQEWSGEGFPAVTTTPTEYSRPPWSPKIIASSHFGSTITRGADPVRALTVHDELDASQWAMAGYPAPTVLDAAYLAYPTSPEIFGAAAGTGRMRLAFEQWAYAGYPAPEVMSFGFVRYEWSPRIIKIDDFDTWSGFQISLGTWESYTYPSPALVDSAGAFVQTPGDPAIFYVDGEVEFQLTFEEWAAADYPPPEQIQ